MRAAETLARLADAPEILSAPSLCTKYCPNTAEKLRRRCEVDPSKWGLHSKFDNFKATSLLRLTITGEKSAKQCQSNTNNLKIKALPEQDTPSNLMETQVGKKNKSHNGQIVRQKAKNSNAWSLECLWQLACVHWNQQRTRRAPAEMAIGTNWRRHDGLKHKSCVERATTRG